jgi:DNA-binding response OmpR family regulator
MKTIKLLLVEDDVSLSYIITCALEGMSDYGYEVKTAANGAEGLAAWEEFHPDIVVSDIEMPVMSGLEMVRKIRQTDREIPIVFITGKTAPGDVIAGYETGVNNYIKKPFTPGELDAHIKAMIHLPNSTKTRAKEGLYSVGKYRFNPKNYMLTYDDVEVKKLTAGESRILTVLLEHKGEVVNRDELLEMSWKGHDRTFASRSLDVFISKLRGYLSKDESVLIENVRTVGLMLSVK